MWSGAWNKKAHFRNPPNRFLPSSVGRTGGHGFKPHWGQFLTKFILCCVTSDLSDNLTEMCQTGLSRKTWLPMVYPVCGMPCPGRYPAWSCLGVGEVPVLVMSGGDPFWSCLGGGVPILILSGGRGYPYPGPVWSGRTVADPVFLRWGAPTSKVGPFGQIFPENCMNMKEFGPSGGYIPGAPPPFTSATRGGTPPVPVTGEGGGTTILVLFGARARDMTSDLPSVCRIADPPPPLKTDRHNKNLPLHYIRGRQKNKQKSSYQTLFRSSNNYNYLDVSSWDISLNNKYNIN